jgi:hypothetical protein
MVSPDLVTANPAYDPPSTRITDPLGAVATALPMVFQGDAALPEPLSLPVVATWRTPVSGTGVGVGAAVGAGVGVAVGAGVGALVGVGVGAGFAVAVGVGAVVGAGVAAGVGDAVGAGVAVGRGVAVGADVGAGVGAGVAVGFGVAVGAGVGSGASDSIVSVTLATTDPIGVASLLAPAPPAVVRTASTRCWPASTLGALARTENVPRPFALTVARTLEPVSRVRA